MTGTTRTKETRTRSLRDTQARITAAATTRTETTSAEAATRRTVTKTSFLRRDGRPTGTRTKVRHTTVKAATPREAKPTETLLEDTTRKATTSMAEVTMMTVTRKEVATLKRGTATTASLRTGSRSPAMWKKEASSLSRRELQETKLEEASTTKVTSADKEMDNYTGDRNRNGGKTFVDEERYYNQPRYDEHSHGQAFRKQGDYNERPRVKDAVYERDVYNKDGKYHGQKGYNYNETYGADGYKTLGDNRTTHHHGREFQRGEHRHHANQPVRDFFAVEDQPNVKPEIPKPVHHMRDINKGFGGGKDMASGVKVTNMISDSAQKQTPTPKLLQELEVPPRPNFSKINKNSQEFMVNAPSLSFGMPNLNAPGVSPTPSMPGMKDLDTPLNTNNYSNNTFSQTIFINPQGNPQAVNPLNPYADTSTAATPNYGLTMPVHPQASIPVNMLQTQMNPLMAMQSAMYANPMLYNPQSYFMNQSPFAMGQLPFMPMMAGMPLDDDTADNSTMFDNQGEFSEELLNMFEMFKDTFLQDGDGDGDAEDEIDIALQEEEFEREHAQAEVFHPEFQDCTCCQGYPLKCKGEICGNLGTCHCALRKIKEEEEAHKDKIFVEEHKDCSCCKGFVYACAGAACKISGRCKCDDE